ncbi:MAG: BON domain-containing protein [Blastocatellia bacterium]
MSPPQTADKPDADQAKTSADALRMNFPCGQPTDGTAFSSPNLIYLTPGEAQRRFPLLTEASYGLIAAGTGLILFVLTIGGLLWWQNRGELARLAAQRAHELAILYPSPTPSPAIAPTPVMPAIPEASPGVLAAPSRLLEDIALTDAVRAALSAYNPVATATRYRVETNNGVVSLIGYALTQPEKTGAENVARSVNGVRLVCSDLYVIPEAQATALSELTEGLVTEETPASLPMPASLNTTAPGPGSATEPPPPPPTPDPRAEAERLQRDQEITRLRAEAESLKQQVEEKNLREQKLLEERAAAIQAQRMQPEITRPETSNPESRRPNSPALQSGTIAWSGVIEGIDEIVIAGAAASVRHVSGEPVKNVRASFSAPVPHAPVTINLLSASAADHIRIVQQPNAANGYTTILRLDDSARRGENRYEFTLKWTLQ